MTATMNRTASVIIYLLDKQAKARGLTDSDLDRLVTARGDALLEKIADLLATEVRGGPKTSYPVTIDYRQTLESMIKAGRYDRVNSDITDKHFPVSAGDTDVVIELVHLNRDASSDDVLAELQRRGLRPATLPELLAFGATYPEQQREFPIVALGSVWQYWSGDRDVPYLWSDSFERCLNQFWIVGRWYALCRFAAVRKRQ
jgi:hypothetical protein